jgi:predicted metal-dependent peptidase
MSSTWNKMSLNDRIISCHVDISNSPKFAGLSGVVYVGEIKIDEAIQTAATNGRDVIYAPSFIEPLTRKQLRFLVLHESLHKALHHCTAYKTLCEKYPNLCNVAMDFVVNGTIEETDPQHEFIDHPTSVPPLLDPKFFGWSFVEVLQYLLKQNGDKDIGDGEGGMGVPMDKHTIGELQEGVAVKTEKEITEALHQGKVLQKRLQNRGSGMGGSPLDKLMKKRDTNWREHLREWATSLCDGDEFSRFAPPNKRLLPLGFIMPSHFSESTGELIVACDTSGSMNGLYPVVFGEIARICENVLPQSVRVLWWEGAVVGDQVFKPHEYQNIARLLKPAGGGGTRVSCVAEYIEDNKLQPKGVLYLTDGYIESDYKLPEFPTLFGVVDNDHFVANKGKTVRIYS